MANVSSVLVQLREERTGAQEQVEKLDEAIAVIQELVGATWLGFRGPGTEPW